MNLRCDTSANFESVSVLSTLANCFRGKAFFYIGMHDTTSVALSESSAILSPKSSARPYDTRTIASDVAENRETRIRHIQQHRKVTRGSRACETFESRHQVPKNRDPSSAPASVSRKLIGKTNKKIAWKNSIDRSRCDHGVRSRCAVLIRRFSAPRPVVVITADSLLNRRHAPLFTSWLIYANLVFICRDRRGLTCRMPATICLFCIRTTLAAESARLDC